MLPARLTWTRFVSSMPADLVGLMKQSRHRIAPQHEYAGLPHELSVVRRQDRTIENEVCAVPADGLPAAHHKDTAGSS
jgi:hypothetical protein